LESLCLAQLQLHSVIGNSLDVFFNFCPTLRMLDLSECELTFLPMGTFSNLTFLEVIDVSHNLLSTLNISLNNCSHLMVLNVSNNEISSLSAESIVQLNTVANRRLLEDNTLTVDLTGNPLSCLCNSTDFVKWMKSLHGIILIPLLDTYTCLYPNGSTVLLARVSVSELEE
jgi:Leucine-rich repeat (LRR) protein